MRSVIGAQVLVTNHYVESIKPLVPSNRPALGIVYSLAAEPVDRINQLEHPSIVSLVSVSEGLLKIAGRLFASAIKKRRVLNEVLVSDQAVLNLTDSDLGFCDMVTLDRVRARNRVQYQLISRNYLSDLAASLN